MKAINLFLFILICDFSFGQQIEWQRTLGGTGSDGVNSICRAYDGTFLIAGSSTSNISATKTENSNGGSDCWIVDIDSTGNIIWQNTIGGNMEDYLVPVAPTSDHGFILGSSSLSGVSGDKTQTCRGLIDYWVIKVDSIGTIEWQKTIGGSNVDKLSSISQTFDGGYICGGYSVSNISGEKTENAMTEDYWVVKLDDQGNIQWQNTIGGAVGDELLSIAQTPDHGFICGGSSWSNISGDKTENNMGGGDYWLVKLDSSGNVMWDNTIGGMEDDQLFKILVSDDGGFICGGISMSDSSGDKSENCQGNYDYWILKVDSLGSIVWQKTIGGNADDHLWDLKITPGNGIVAIGYSESNASGNKSENCIGDKDFWIIELDSAGAIQWQKTIGGSDYDNGSAVLPVGIGRYFCAGSSKSDSSLYKTENCLGYLDYWTFILNQMSVGSSQTPSSIFHCDIFPNPTSEKINITWTGITDEMSIIVYGILGECMFHITGNSSHETQIDLSGYPSGIYFIQAFSGDKIFNSKVIKN